MPKQEYLLELYAAGSLSVLGDGWEQMTADAFDSPGSPDPRSRWIVRGEADTSPSRYLEMGPGDGTLLKHFENNGWDCYGIGPGTWARKKPNFVETLDQLPNEIDFEVIPANDVLEHTSDLVDVVRRLADSLSPTGRMYFSFPNCSSLRASIQGERWRMIRPIGHLHYFSRRSVVELLSRSKLTLRRVESFDLLAPVGQQLRAVASSALGLDLRGSVGAMRNLAASISSETIGRGDQWRVIAERWERSPE